MEYNYNSEDILLRLEELKNSDIEAFTDLILAVFRIEPDSVIEDPHPSANKIIVLDSIIEYLETTERYEDCAFIKNIIDKINEQ